MRELIKEILRKNLIEIRVIDYLSDFNPINDSDKIRVYHGFYTSNDAYRVLTSGLSGQEQAKRIYSYESGNNPKGLFVSISFNTVKKNFASSGIIIEFDTIATNLEAPVWKGQDSYFVQGQYTKNFANDDERNVEIQRKREKYGKEDPEGKWGKNRISKSQRPELADSIFNNAEHQALFIGNLNPNEIKNVWFHEGRFFNNTTLGEWVRYDRKTFLRKYGNDLKSEKRSRGDNPTPRIFNPNDDLTVDKLKQIALKNEWDYEGLVDDIKNGRGAEEYYLWPKQVRQFRELVQNKKI